MVFYRAKADALDESSHLQGRTEGTEITSARRSRAVGGVFKMTMKQLGGLGVGRVAGYLHPARSTTQPLAQQAPSPGSAAPKEDDAGRVARMEACNNLTPKYVGATTQGFPCSVPAIGLAPAHIDRLHAKIVYTATIADAAGPQGSLEVLRMRSSRTVRCYPVAASESGGVQQGRGKLWLNSSHRDPRVVLELGSGRALTARPPSWPP